MRLDPAHLCPICLMAIDRKRSYCEVCIELVEKLKLCPFCDSHVDMEINTGYSDEPATTEVYCASPHCSVHPRIVRDTTYEATVDWNNLTPDDKFKTELEYVLGAMLQDEVGFCTSTATQKVRNLLKGLS